MSSRLVIMHLPPSTTSRLTISLLKIYRGPIIHSMSHSAAEFCKIVTIIVSHGIIEEIRDSDLEPCPGDTKIVAKEGEFLMPGFVDTHTHACQFSNLGIVIHDSGEGHELLDWLSKVTFPTEEKFSDINVAKKVYAAVVKNLLAFGTTTCCYYGTLHLDATKILVDEVKKSGQRAFVGKCNMDKNATYPAYVEKDAATSIDETKKLIEYIRSVNPDTKVDAIITPRFALSCSTDLLTGLGKLAGKYSPPVRIQTHISENKAEIRQTLAQFPECQSYSAVYDKFGLLREGTILAHGCWLDDEELKLIQSRKSCISHCPTSNLNLRSGIARVSEMLHRNIEVGLGTDVSGGFAPSILTEIRHANMASKALELSLLQSSVVPRPSLSIKQLLYLATLGGAKVCGLGKVGNFKKGNYFDALLVSVRADAGNPAVWWEDLEDLEKRLERFFFCGNERNIKKVWVQGNCVKGEANY
ncbi:Guanine deaminase [Mycena venus]|uniref:Guanine deaminase n=1 Tax=Mycena venus TaxID=2733690 RepID=A0A8H6YW92_9AGAR|nr:Guanine deaminase [Mycena venus]